MDVATFGCNTTQIHTSVALDLEGLDTLPTPDQEQVAERMWAPTVAPFAAALASNQLDDAYRYLSGAAHAYLFARGAVPTRRGSQRRAGQP